MTMSGIEQIEFADNPEPRCPCVLLLDTSGSMAGIAINELNAGLKAFKEGLISDTLASARVEIAIITFDTTVIVVQDFITVDQFHPPTLTAQGGTDIGAGIEKALDIIEVRKTIYKSTGVAYYRPWVFTITDGEPTASYEQAVARLQEAEKTKRVAFFVVGVEEANMERLSQITVRPPVKLKGLHFRDMFLWLSASLQAVSQSKPGDLVPLPPTSWGEI